MVYNFVPHKKFFHTLPERMTFQDDDASQSFQIQINPNHSETKIAMIGR